MTQWMLLGTSSRINLSTLPKCTVFRPPGKSWYTPAASDWGGWTMAVKGKVVAITGAARGMGRAYVQGFMAEGARVIALDRSWDPTGFSGDEDDSFRKQMESRKGDVVLATA